MKRSPLVLSSTLFLSIAVFFALNACSGSDPVSNDVNQSSSSTGELQSSIDGTSSDGTSNGTSSTGTSSEDLSSVADITCPEGTDTVLVAAGNDAIAYDGVWYPAIAPDSAVLLRHSPECLRDGNCVPGWTGQYGYDRCHPGVVIRFRTNAPAIRMVLAEDPTVPEGNRRYPYMKVGVYVDGVFNSQRGPMTRVTTGKSYTVIPADPSAIHTYEIVMPHQLASIFYGVLLPQGGCLQPVGKLNKPVYVAVGNSLTHGEGQNSSYEGFAWKVARAKGWELVNLAVGGTTISPEMISKNFTADKRVDVVSVEWGYNDWASALHTIDKQTPKFKDALTAIRTTHPNAKIYVITPFTTTTQNYNCVKDGVCTADNTTIADWRKMMEDEVAARVAAGDNRIFVIKGDEISTAEDLTTDGVHLSTAGAANVAQKLIEQMNLD